MARKVEHVPTQIKIGGPGVPVEDFNDRWSEAVNRPRAEDHVGEDALIEQLRLTPGVSVNGEPALIPSGASIVRVVRAKCDCGAGILEVWRIPATPSRPRPTYFAEVQHVEDQTTRPVTMRLSRRMLSGDHPVVTECPAHGERQIPAAPLLKAARDMEGLIVGGRSRVKTLIFRR